jgi:hypothetical protein
MPTVLVPISRPPWYVPGVITELCTGGESGQVVFSKGGVVGTRVFEVPWVARVPDPDLPGNFSVITWLDYCLWFLGRTYRRQDPAFPLDPTKTFLAIAAPDVFDNTLNWLLCQEAQVRGMEPLGYEGQSDDLPAPRPAKPYPPGGPNDPPPPFTEITNFPDPPPSDVGYFDTDEYIDAAGKFAGVPPPTSSPSAPETAVELPGFRSTSKDPMILKAGIPGALPKLPTPVPWVQPSPGNPGSVLTQFSPRVVYRTAIITCKYQAITADETMSMSSRSHRRRGLGYGWTDFADDPKFPGGENQPGVGIHPPKANLAVYDDIGVQVRQGEMSFLKRNVLTPDFPILMDLVGCVNHAPFLGWPRHAVLFLGGDGRRNWLPNGTPVWDIHLRLGINKKALWNREWRPNTGAWEYLKTVRTSPDGKAVTASGAGTGNYIYDEADLSPLLVYR